MINLRKYWLEIMLVFTVIILFGSISLKFNVETFNNDCPDTQNCSKGGIVHRSDKVALELDKKNYLDEINKLKGRLNSSVTETNNLESKMADLQNDLIDRNSRSREWQQKYDNLSLAYQNLNKKINLTKELLKKEQSVANKSAYLEIPNFECIGCNEIKTFETSFDKCQEICNETDDCDLINYYNPNKVCKLINGLDYDKMKYSSYDMYIKTNKNKMTQFDINKIIKPQSVQVEVKPVETQKAIVKKPDIAEKKKQLQVEIDSLIRQISQADASLNFRRAKQLEAELANVKAEYNKLLATAVKKPNNAAKKKQLQAEIDSLISQISQADASLNFRKAKQLEAELANVKAEYDKL